MSALRDDIEQYRSAAEGQRGASELQRHVVLVLAEIIQLVGLDLLTEEHARGILTAAALMEGRAPDKLAEYMEELERAKRQPFMSSDRSPRQEEVIIDGLKVKTGRVLAPDGTYLYDDKDG